MTAAWSRTDDLQAIAAVSRGSGFTTNLYAPTATVRQWLDTEQCVIRSADGAALVLRRDREFERVYHVAASRYALSRALADLPDGVYVADLVGRCGTMDEMVAAYAEAGFIHHGGLRRMARAGTTPGGPVDQGKIEVARLPDVPLIAAFLAGLLDPFAEQIPDDVALTATVSGERLLIVRGDEGVAGLLMYEVKGRLAHLQFWHVAPWAQGRGVGRALMARFLAACAQVDRIVLWVLADNQRSIDIYRHYGFALDNLFDSIMLLRKGSVR